MNEYRDTKKFDLMERLFYKMNQYGGVTSIYMVGVRGYLNKETIEVSAATVTARHPILHSIINIEERANPVFQVVEEYKLPLIFDSVSDESGIHHIIEREMKRDFIPSGLLWNIIILEHTENPDSHTLIFAASHIIADGHTLIMFINELFNVYDALEKGNDISTTPPIGNREFSPFDNAYSKEPSVWSKLLYCGREAVKMLIPITPVTVDSDEAPLEKRCTRIIFRTMPGDMLRSLRERSTANGVTLNATLLGALLFTLPFFVTARDRMRFTLSTNVTLRSDFPGLRDTWGVFAPALQICRKITPETEFWETVRSLKKESDRLISSHAYIRSLQLQVWALLSPLFKHIVDIMVHGVAKGRLTGASLSNMGRVNLTQNTGFLSVESLHCFGSQHGLGNVFTLYCNTLDSILFYNIAYVFPIIEDDTARLFITQMETVIREAVHNDHLSLHQLICNPYSPPCGARP